VLRARIVLSFADGMSKTAIAGHLATSRPTVDLCPGVRRDWARRAARRRGQVGESLWIPTRRLSIIEWTLHRKPKGQTLLNQVQDRTLAKALGVGSITVLNVWHNHGLKPYRTETFKLSSAPHFVEKVRDVVGLYLSPPEKALVLSVDEKSQIQALDRTPAHAGGLGPPSDSGQPPNS
jgi:hypothetical protein